MESFDLSENTESQRIIEDLSFSKLFKDTEITSKILTEKLNLENFDRSNRLYTKSTSKNEKYCKDCTKNRSDLKQW